jgi:maltose alpha-D-glucosyltransferase/alpha-amylase
MAVRPLRAIYQIDPYLFRDSHGRGWGTLDGITEKLDHLQWLGISHVWLLPFYCNAGRDGGYDVTDHYRIDPRLGDETAFQRLVDAADARGIGIIVELVMQHTASAHPGSSPRSRATRPGAPGTSGATTCLTTACSRCSADRGLGLDMGCRGRRVQPAHVLPARAGPRAGPCAGSRGTAAGNDVWLQRGVAGFAWTPFRTWSSAPATPTRATTGCGCWRRCAPRQTRSNQGLPLIGEADVARHYGDFLCHGRRLSHLLDFHLNNHFFLALARGDASEVARVMAEYGPHAPPDTRIAWLRNNDELDLEQLEPDEREAVMERFAP